VLEKWGPPTDFGTEESPSSQLANQPKIDYQQNDISRSFVIIFHLSFFFFIS